MFQNHLQLTFILSYLSRMEGQIMIVKHLLESIISLTKIINGWIVLKVANRKQRPKENPNALSFKYQVFLWSTWHGVKSKYKSFILSILVLPSVSSPCPQLLSFHAIKKMLIVEQTRKFLRRLHTHGVCGSQTHCMFPHAHTYKHTHIYLY